MPVEHMSADKNTRVGIVGIGFGQQVLAPAFASVAGCEVRAICATQQARAASVAARLGIERAYGDWRKLVDDSDLDAVAIATPPSVQPTIALAALGRGKGVFCEKPMATSASVASDMVSEAQRAGVANMVDFEFPEIEAWRRAKSILDSGSLGPLRHIAVVWNVETYANRHGLRSWKTSAEGGGGVLNAFVSHAFYYLEWFVGSIGRLSARLLRMPGDERTGDTLAVLCLELESGLPVSISVSSHAFLGSGHRVEFYGQEGTLMLDNRTADYIQGFKLFYGTRASNRLEVVASDDPKDTVTIDGRIDAVARLTKRFVNWIKTGLPSAPNFQDGLRVQKLLEAAWLSHQAGGIVQEVSYRI